MSNRVHLVKANFCGLFLSTRIGSRKFARHSDGRRSHAVMHLIAGNATQFRSMSAKANTYSSVKE